MPTHPCGNLFSSAPAENRIFHIGYLNSIDGVADTVAFRTEINRKLKMHINRAA